MFRKSSDYEYQLLSEKEGCSKTLDLFSSSHDALTYSQCHQRGHSFDYVPKVAQNDFTGKSLNIANEELGSKIR